MKISVTASASAAATTTGLLLLVVASSIGSTSAFLASVVAKPRCSLLLRASSSSSSDDPSESSEQQQEQEQKNLVANAVKNAKQQQQQQQEQQEQEQLKKMSQSIPFSNCPPFLDGSIAGDVGFDPFGFAVSRLTVTNYREAEIKHARLAMLAAAGWPLSELFDKDIANLVGMTSKLDLNGRVPSVLNGGMEKINPVYWGVCVGVAAVVDLYVINSSSKKEGYYPGKLGFDPFGLYPKDEEGQKWMQTAEIKNGRLAMIAITAFAVTEYVTHIAIIDQTPVFFHPIWETIFTNNDNDIIIGSSSSSTTSAIVEAVSSSLSSDPATATAALGDGVAAETAATAITPSLDAATDAVSSPPVAVVVDNEELIAAKKRIAELETKLEWIGKLTH